MADFYQKALKKTKKLNAGQSHELLVSAVGEINLLETVFNSIDVGILVCDVNNKLVMINKYAQRLLTVNDTENSCVWAAVNDERIAGFLEETLLNRDRVMDKEIDIIHQGRNRLLLINILPLVQEKKITGSLIYIDDITEKRQDESRLRRAENLASLTTLAAGVAHEIKNPLGSISIHLQLMQKSLLKKKASDPKIEKYFKVLNEEVERLNRIVVDFLFAVRPVNLELREGDINKIITRMMEFVAIEIKRSKILCLLELDENVPKIILDERLIKQALLNLVKNAQAAMPKGGVMTIATKFADDEIKISICDTGVGIGRENLKKIFEPYFTTAESGTGLGLTQVYKIIREHKGEITVDSALEGGTEFKITLPVPQKETRMIQYKE